MTENNLSDNLIMALRSKSTHPDKSFVAKLARKLQPQQSFFAKYKVALTGISGILIGVMMTTLLFSLPKTPTDTNDITALKTSITPQSSDTMITTPSDISPQNYQPQLGFAVRLPAKAINISSSELGQFDNDGKPHSLTVIYADQQTGEITLKYTQSRDSIYEYSSQLIDLGNGTQAKYFECVAIYSQNYCNTNQYQLPKAVLFWNREGIFYTLEKYGSFAKSELIDIAKSIPN